MGAQISGPSNILAKDANESHPHRAVSNRDVSYWYSPHSSSVQRPLRSIRISLTGLVENLDKKVPMTAERKRTMTAEEKQRQTHRDMYEYHLKQVFYYLKSSSDIWGFTGEEREIEYQRILGMMGFKEESPSPSTDLFESTDTPPG